MTTSYSIGIVHCGVQPEPVFHADAHRVTKVYVEDESALRHSQANYPEAEIVYEKEKILHDEGIDLVIICKPKEEHRLLISECLKARKSVQVINS